jgi:FKBP-type peptidyl-prolyl cis-trans isomerase
VNKPDRHIITIFVAVVICTILLSLSGCKNKSDTSSVPVSVDKERLLNINKLLADKDKDVIEHLIRRQGWRMKAAPDGYYYEIFNAGKSPKADTTGRQVVYEYTISLLDGTLCYTSSGGEPKTFVVGGSDEISGMHHAVGMLGKGGKARFIFPPQLAYGLQGDFDKIPPRASLIYKVEIADIK